MKNLIDRLNRWSRRRQARKAITSYIAAAKWLETTSQAPNLQIALRIEARREAARLAFNRTR